MFIKPCDKRNDSPFNVLSSLSRGSNMLNVFGGLMQPIIVSSLQEQFARLINSRMSICRLP